MGTFTEPFFHMIKGEKLHLRGVDGAFLRKLTVNDINETLGINWFQHKTTSSYDGKDIKYEPICELEGYQCSTEAFLKAHRLKDKQLNPHHWKLIFTHWPYQRSHLTVYVKNVHED